MPVTVTVWKIVDISERQKIMLEGLEHNLVQAKYGDDPL